MSCAVERVTSPLCGWVRAACLLAALGSSPALVSAAERVCDQSDPQVQVAPGGRLASSIQHQVCETAAGGVAAAVTVFVGDAAKPLEGTRVLAVPVPRTREQWPRAVWRSPSTLELWVPNLTEVMESRADASGVDVKLRYCGDDPHARERVARHEADLEAWKQAVTRWAAQRRDDPQRAGPRPARPEEPRRQSRACTDEDIAGVAAD